VRAATLKPQANHAAGIGSKTPAQAADTRTADTTSRDEVAV